MKMDSENCRYIGGLPQRALSPFPNLLKKKGTDTEIPFRAVLKFFGPSPKCSAPQYCESKRNKLASSKMRKLKSLQAEKLTN